MGRTYDANLRDRKITDALQGQSLRDGAATCMGDLSFTALIDLTKAFEHASLVRAWQHGIDTSYPLQILRLSLEAFAMPRHLTFSGDSCAYGNHCRDHFRSRRALLAPARPG